MAHAHFGECRLKRNQAAARHDACLADDFNRYITAPPAARFRHAMPRQPLPHLSLCRAAGAFLRDVRPCWRTRKAKDYQCRAAY